MSPPAESHAAAAQGLTALGIWATTVALLRSLSESVGALTGAAAALAGGGLLSMGFALARWPLPALGCLLAVGGTGLAVSGRSVVEVLALSLGPMAIAYSLWERGVRRGRHALLGLASYFVPVDSLTVAGAYLGVIPGARLAGGCLLIVAGALVSRWPLPG